MQTDVLHITRSNKETCRSCNKKITKLSLYVYLTLTFLILNSLVLFQHPFRNVVQFSFENRFLSLLKEVRLINWCFTDFYTAVMFSFIIYSKKIKTVQLKCNKCLKRILFYLRDNRNCDSFLKHTDIIGIIKIPLKFVLQNT